MIYTNNAGLPQSLYSAIVNDPYDLDVTDLSTISNTTLINSPRVRLLTLRHYNEIEVDALNRVWAMFGTAVHTVLERIPVKDMILEKRITIPVGDKAVSAKTDYYSNGLIQDYKVTSAWTIKNNSQHKKWVEQLNVCAYTFRKTGYDVTDLQIVAILRDWSKWKALQSKLYPKQQVVTVKLPLWDVNKQEGFIKERVGIHQAAESLPDDDLPLCTTEERWERDKKCLEYCECNKFCNYYKKIKEEI